MRSSYSPQRVKSATTISRLAALGDSEFMRYGGRALTSVNVAVTYAQRRKAGQGRTESVADSTIIVGGSTLASVANGYGLLKTPLGFGSTPGAVLAGYLTQQKLTDAMDYLDSIPPESGVEFYGP